MMKLHGRFFLALILGVLLVFSVALGAVTDLSNGRRDTVGNGNTKAFSFTFPARKTSDIEVYVGGVKQTTGYTVTLAVAPDTGGTVTFDAAPASQAAIRIQRTMPITQETVSPSSAKITEKALDVRAMVEQQLDRKITDSESAITAIVAKDAAQDALIASKRNTTDQAARDNAQDNAIAAAANVHDAVQDARDDAQDALIAATRAVAGVSDDATVLTTGTTTARPLKERSKDSGLNVLDCGAKGDGVTRDHIAIRECIDKAGMGGKLLFPPGKTWLLCGFISPLAYQTWEMGGTKFTRCNQHATSITSEVTSGSGARTFTVADASGFQIGDEVTFFDPAGDKTTACSLPSGCWYEWINHPITDINGNTITIQTASALVSTWPIGSTVVTSIETIATDGDPIRKDGVHLYGGEIDGNRANNTAFGQWPNNTEIWLNGKGTVIRDMYIHDGPGEGIEIAGGSSDIACTDDGAFAYVEDNRIENMNGNGIHTAGGPTYIRGNTVRNVNLRPLGAQGHDDGGIIASNGTCWNVIDGNFITSTTLAGIGSIDSVDNSRVVISNNFVKDAKGNALDILNARDAIVEKVIVTGNQFQDSGPVLIMQGGGTQPSEKGPRHVIFASNILEDTALDVRYAQDISIIGNQIHFDPAGASSTGYAVRTYDVRGLLFALNTVSGRDVGWYVDGDPTRGFDQQIRASGNYFRNQKGYGVYVVADVTGNPWASEMFDNTFVSSIGISSASYTAAVLKSGWAANRNRVHLPVGQRGISIGSNRVTANDNKVSGVSTQPIYIAAGVSGVNVERNETNVKIWNDASDTNTVKGNWITGERRIPDADVVDAAFATTITLDAGKGGVFDVQASGTTAFAFATPTGGVEGQRIAVTVENAGFDTLSATTPFGSSFVLAPWTQPAEGYSRSITFRKGGNFWIEESRTPADVPLPTSPNLAKNSEALDNWTAYLTTVAANAATAPDGTATMDMVTNVGTTSASVYTTGFTGTAAQYTFSIWIRAGTSTAAALAIYSPTAGFATFTAKIVSGPGAVVASGSTTAAVSGLSASSDTRVQITATLTSAVDWRGYLYNTGVAGSTLYGWGAQIVLGNTSLYYQGPTGP